MLEYAPAVRQGHVDAECGALPSQEPDASSEYRWRAYVLSRSLEVSTALNLNQRFRAPQVKHSASEVEAGSRCNEHADVRSWLLPVEKGVAWKAL